MSDIIEKRITLLNITGISMGVRFLFFFYVLGTFFLYISTEVF